MDHIVALLSQHGLVAVFLAVFIEQVGAPLPSLPFLLLAGATMANERGAASRVVAVAVLAAMLANALWFVTGRRLGRRVLVMLCRISISAEHCVRQSEVNFAKFGAGSLVIAKFIPGLSVLAPPLAGALGMGVRRFALYNVAGALLWAGGGVGAGMYFHTEIQQFLELLGNLGGTALLLFGLILTAYLAVLTWRRRRVSQQMANVSRIAPEELKALMEGNDRLVLLDVQPRSPGLEPANTIPGARHVDLSQMKTTPTLDWPEQAVVVTYCACANDVTAIEAAQTLEQRGIPARALMGGIDAWSRAGHSFQDKTNPRSK